MGNGQEWMTENLRTDRYRNGERIPNVTENTQWVNLTSGAWAHYDNNSEQENPMESYIIGMLYQIVGIYARRAGMCHLTMNGQNLSIF